MFDEKEKKRNKALGKYTNHYIEAVEFMEISIVT